MKNCNILQIGYAGCLMDFLVLYPDSGDSVPICILLAPKHTALYESISL
jgi:hypothetical protein